MNRINLTDIIIKKQSTVIRLRRKLIPLKDNFIFKYIPEMLHKSLRFGSSVIFKYECESAFIHSVHCLILIHHIDKSQCHFLLYSVTAIHTIQNAYIIQMIYFQFDYCNLCLFFYYFRYIRFKSGSSIQIGMSIYFRLHIVIAKHNYQILISGTILHHVRQNTNHDGLSIFDKSDYQFPSDIFPLKAISHRIIKFQLIIWVNEF